jgi:hypothetical protein
MRIPPDFLAVTPPASPSHDRKRASAMWNGACALHQQDFSLRERNFRNMQNGI